MRVLSCQSMGGVLLCSLALLFVVLLSGVSESEAQVPATLNYQGRVVMDGTNFNGTGLFKFAMVNAQGTLSYWSNDGSSTNGSLPSQAVTLSVARGLFALALGDTNLANMIPVPATVFTNSDVRLRVWFDGGKGFQWLTPDQRMSAVGYAMISASVLDGAITPAKLAPATTGLFVNPANNLADLSNAVTARVNLGLGSMALQNAPDVAITGGAVTNVAVQVKADQFAVGTNQLMAISNRVGIGTATPSAKLEVVGGTAAGEYVMKIYSGTNLVAWGKKKQ